MKLVAPICLLKKFPRETSLGLSPTGKILLWTGVIQYLAYCISNNFFFFDQFIRMRNRGSDWRYPPCFVNALFQNPPCWHPINFMPTGCQHGEFGKSAIMNDTLSLATISSYPCLGLWPGGIWAGFFLHGLPRWIFLTRVWAGWVNSVNGSTPGWANGINGSAPCRPTGHNRFTVWVTARVKIG